jgi:hypothetical protein
MVRGRDMDIADIVVKGFGDRELGFGDGLVLQSPIDIGAQINVDDPTEDDILHTSNLPTFGGTLTTEESEMLLSILTTPYLRIPMVLQFFASSDRHSYLLHEDLQRVLRATLFEPGVHYGGSVGGSSGTAPSGAAFPTEIPLRLTRQQKADVQIAVIRGDLSRSDHTALLGTSCGLLINELAYSPSSVFRPLQQLVKTVAALGQCSVYSVNASYALYLLNVCTDVLSYALFALQQQSQRPPTPNPDVQSPATAPPTTSALPRLREPAEVERAMGELQAALDEVIGDTLVPSWFAEAEENDDTPTLCVLESYMAAFTKVKLSTLTWERRHSGSAHMSSSSGSVMSVDSKIQASLISLLASCSYVRARHGFGMGTQRTQLAAQSNDALLTPEEKLLRFMQAQGLETTRVSKEMLEHGRRLMTAGGKRRAVFLQIRSRFYNDTVRVPNLFRAETAGSGGTSDAKRMKLPPLDVPEHLIFSILLEEHRSLSLLLRSALAVDAPAIGMEGRRRMQLDRIMNAVVQRVLREKPTNHIGGGAPSSHVSEQAAGGASRRDDAWDVSIIKPSAAGPAPAPGAAEGQPAPPPTSVGLVFSAPSSGLTFHLQTCELFWRNDELKPVPDSMSHYTDYETILGKDVMQCGLVRRSLHRHWIHIVGTPYDVVEWDTTDPEDQGVHQPRVLMGPPTCECVEQVKYDGVLFDRLVNVDDEAPWPVSDERWAIDLLRRVLKEAFPNPGEMKYKPLAISSEDMAAALQTNEEEEAGQGSSFRLIMNDKPQYEKEEDRNTWKEIVITKDPRQLLVFNLVPHARGTYRSLVFCTDQRLALHSLALLRRPRDAHSLKYLHYQAGELKRRVQNEGSLEIWRFNAQIRGREVFTPARLLQGVVPSALLESFLFWHGEDDVIRGYPMSEEDDPTSPDNAAASSSRQATLQHWFRYAVEVRFVGGNRGGAARRCMITRRNDMSYTTAGLDHRNDCETKHVNRQQLEAAIDAASGMRRSVSFEDHHNTMGSPAGSSGPEASSGSLPPRSRTDDASLAVLRSVYPSLPHGVLKYALLSTQLNISDAIEWISAAENESTITGLIQGGGADAVSSPTARRGGATSPMLSGSQRSRSRTVDFEHAAPATATASTVHGDDAGELDDVSPIRERSMTSIPRVGGADDDEENDLPQHSAAAAHPLTGSSDVSLVSVWRLLHLAEVASSHPLRPLLDVLTKVEDASHILVWGVDQAAAAGEGVANEEDAVRTGSASGTFLIHLIELPRLRAKFQPKPISEGTHTTTRLLLLDHPGWMLATDADLAPPPLQAQQLPDTGAVVKDMVDRRKGLQQLAAPFPQHMILRNVSEEFALFVPNHDFAKLIVQDNPYATELLFDRSSLQWQESVPSPFYLYNVHASGAFVVAPSLGASLYLAALCCMHRMYEVALRTLESCYVDIDFTVEEAYMCALMQRTLDRNAPDLHPDAHAVRIKLAHAVMYSDNKLAWPLHVELESYLEKSRHVSANCRLQREELFDLMKRCGRAPPLLKSQLQLWVPFLKHERRRSKEPSLVVRAATQPHLLRMGQPWDKLLTMSFESISRRTISRIHYKAPAQPLVGEQLVKLLWEDELIADEESGANRQLGFFFLYQLKRGRIPASLSGNANSGIVEGKNIAGSLAQIMSRYFHLRHSRWGKEAQEAGESEAVPSFAMCVLGVMDSFPAAAWPDMSDRGTLDAMARGTSTSAPSGSDDALGEGGMNLALRGRGGDRRTKLPEMIRGLERLLRTLYSTSMIRIQSIRRELQRGHQPFQDMRSDVTMWSHITPRILPSNTASSSVSVRVCDVYGGAGLTNNQHSSNAGHSTTSDLEYMSTMPLNAAGLFAPRILSSTNAAMSEDNEERSSTAAFISASTVTRSSADSSSVAQPTGTSSPLLPFDVSTHPWAANHIAKDMLERLGQDAQRYAEMQRSTVAFSLSSFHTETVKQLVETLSSSSTTLPIASPTASVESMKDTVTRLVHTLMHLNRVDEAAIHYHRQEMLRIANRAEKEDRQPATTTTNASATAGAANHRAHQYRLQKIRRDRQDVAVEWLCGALLSTKMERELATINPYHGDVEALRSHTAWLMLCSNRRAFGTNALAAARALLVFTSQVLVPLMASASSLLYWCDDAAVLSTLRRHGVDWSTHSSASREERARVVAEAIGSRVSTLVRGLVELLTAQRYHAEQPQQQQQHNESSSFVASTTMEPRFLLFEFLFSFLLRKRQVEMVRWFVANVSEHGISRVQQMLMGQGKTTVVGPLLALILADGKQLVTQVMPTALLEQSRTVLRRCFSTIVPKRILTLQFDRSTDDDANVAEALFQKLDSARRMRAVVVSAPECVKALFLKYVEELHVIETIGNNDLDATTTALNDDNEEQPSTKLTTDVRRGREVKLLRDKTIARSNMADALVPILDLWRNGVMMMDEVDVLLHPLRSELNFPIGLKYPIDMSGARWNLPMHLLSAVFPNGQHQSVQGDAMDGGDHDRQKASVLYGLPHVEVTYTPTELTFVTSSLQNTHEQLQAVIQRGLSSKALQREPHMVLLDLEFYRTGPRCGCTATSKAIDDTGGRSHRLPTPPRPHPRRLPHATLLHRQHRIHSPLLKEVVMLSLRLMRSWKRFRSS